MLELVGFQWIEEPTPSAPALWDAVLATIRASVRSCRRTRGQASGREHGKPGRGRKFLQVHAWPAVMNDNLAIGAATRATAALTLQGWFPQSIKMDEITSAGKVAGSAASLDKD